MTKYFFILIILIAGSATKLFAQDSSLIETDRPDQTETPFTVSKKHFQMETGFSFEQTSTTVKSYSTPSVLFKYGLNDHFEVGIITEITTTRSDQTMTGLNPVTVRFKERIFEEKGVLPTTSFIGYLTMPTIASRNLRATYLAPAFRFTMQHTLSDKISLGYNLGEEWDGESPNPTFIYTLTTGYSISKKVAAFTELYGFAPHSLKASHLFDCGFSYLFRSNISADISGGVGLTKNAPDYFTAIGFSFRLKD